MTARQQYRLALVGVTYPFRGGISHYTTLLFNALASRHEVRFFALSRQYPEFLFPGKTQLDASDSALIVDCDRCIDSINPCTWGTTARRIVNFKPDLILFSWWHPFFAPSFGTIAKLCRRFGIPGCFLCHNVMPHESSCLDRILLRYAYSGVPVFITHGAADERILKEQYPGRSIFRNPHPTYETFNDDTGMTDAEAKEQLGLAGKNVLLFFGYIRRYKGLRFLLRAVEQLTDSDNCCLLVVGEFYEQMENYQPSLDNLTKSSRLKLVDRYIANEEVGIYFRAADIVIVPYTSATQSGIIQMAYGFAKPVVATSVGGLPDVVVDRKTGYLVPPGDSDAIVDVIRDYFSNERKESFIRNVTDEREKYSWDHMVDTIEKAVEAGKAKGSAG